MVIFKMKFLIYCFFNSIIISTAFPSWAETFPKFCGVEFSFQEKPYCVKTLASSAEETILEIVTPQWQTLEEKTTGLEYRQYQLLSTCENSQLSLNDSSLFLIQLRYLDAKGKVFVPNATSDVKKPANYDSDLAWTAYQISCESRDLTNYQSFTNRLSP